MSQGGPNSSSGSGASPVETLTGNSGGAVSPDGSFNIDILGNNATGIDIVGTPASSLLTVSGIAASESQVGTVELATGAETTTGTSTTLAIHPSGLNTKLGTQTSHGLIYGQGGAGSNLGALAEASNGQLPIGSTGNAPVLATLTAGTNISITNGAGSITINSTGGGVTGPGSTTDNAVARWDGTGGTALLNSTMIISDAGEMTNASQPAFLVRRITTDANVTGGGTTYTADWDQTVFDTASAFSSPVFIAPITGRYQFNCSAMFSDLDSNMFTAVYEFITSNRNYTGSYWAPFNDALAETNGCVSFSVLADMDATDTCSVQITISGSSDVADFEGTTNSSSFSGFLVS